MSGHDVVIVGDGAASISAAASLRRGRPGLDIAIFEPSGTHDYQPGFTLVGAGILTPDQLRRPTASLIPRGAAWIRTAATAFQPQSNNVILEDGRVDFDAMLKGHEWRAAPKPFEGAGR